MDLEDKLKVTEVQKMQAMHVQMSNFIYLKQQDRSGDKPSISVSYCSKTNMEKSERDFLQFKFAFGAKHNNLKHNGYNIVQMQHLTQQLLKAGVP